MSLLLVSDISKSYTAPVDTARPSVADSGSFLLKNISFSQQPLQKIAIAGETGSGKTTLMKIIGGLGQADSGTITFEGKPVRGVKDKLMPGHAGIAYLSQHFELNNNYRVEELLSYANNLTYSASVQLYAVCRISHLLKRVAHTLSGGEKQRVALARLLTMSPRLLLLDEPFSNMDLIHKNILKEVIDDLSLSVTCMLISHDPQDTLPWADEILVMKQGEIIQRGAPGHIYSKPHTAYAAGLFGKYSVLGPVLAVALKAGEHSNIFHRPEDFILVHKESNGIKAVVKNIAYFGSHYELQLEAAQQIITVKTDISSLEQGNFVFVRLKEFTE